MSNCSVCHKPILNSGDFSSPAKFKIRCPWCQSTLQVSVSMKITVEEIDNAPAYNNRLLSSQNSLVA